MSERVLLLNANEPKDDIAKAYVEPSLRNFVDEEARSHGIKFSPELRNLIIDGLRYRGVDVQT